MEIKDNQIFVEPKELGFLLRNCIRNYMFFHRNELPESLTIPMIDVFKFRVDATSPELSVPIKFADMKEKSSAVNRPGRTSRNSKAAISGSPDNSD